MAKEKAASYRQKARRDERTGSERDTVAFKAGEDLFDNFVWETRRHIGSKPASKPDLGLYTLEARAIKSFLREA